jgi:hypothetical protein
MLSGTVNISFHLIIKIICTVTFGVLFDVLIVLKDAVHLLTVSHDGQFIVAGDHQSNIVVWNTSNWKVIFS